MTHGVIRIIPSICLIEASECIDLQYSLVVASVSVDSVMEWVDGDIRVFITQVSIIPDFTEVVGAEMHGMMQVLPQITLILVHEEIQVQ